MLALTLASVFLSAPLFLTAASTTGSSCTKTPHVTPEVTWTTVKCAFCFPKESRKNDTLWVNYNGTLASNGKAFDSSYSTDKPWPLGDPFSFVLGNKSVIAGFDAGAYGMCPGETRHLLIPSKYAYGEKGTGDGVIPPNADLVFDIALMGIGLNYTAASGRTK